MEIFVSVSRADLPRIESLIGRLRGMGFNIFTDSDPLWTWLPWQTIIEKLTFCTLVLIVMSRESVDDKGLRSERKYAVQEAYRPVVVVVLDPVTITELFPDQGYQTLPVVDYTQPNEGCNFCDPFPTLLWRPDN